MTIVAIALIAAPNYGLPARPLVLCAHTPNRVAFKSYLNRVIYLFRLSPLETTGCITYPILLCLLGNVSV